MIHFFLCDQPLWVTTNEFPVQYTSVISVEVQSQHEHESHPIQDIDASNISITSRVFETSNLLFSPIPQHLFQITLHCLICKMYTATTTTITTTPTTLQFTKYCTHYPQGQVIIINWIVKSSVTSSGRISPQRSHHKSPQNLSKSFNSQHNQSLSWVPVDINVNLFWL